MVLTATSTDSESKERPKITPFQNWFNKRQNILKEEYMKEFIDFDKEHKEGFIRWCKEEYGKKDN